MKHNLRRVFVEKKPGFDIEATGLCRDLQHHLGIEGLERVRIVIRYDLEGLSEVVYQQSRFTILSEPPVDFFYEEQLPLEAGVRVLAIEYLPGQYDQRADSAAQCIQILSGDEPPRVRVAKILIFEGELSDLEYEKIKAYCINPVEAHEASLVKPETLALEINLPESVPQLKGFLSLELEGLTKLHLEMGLAMSVADLEFCQQYFRETEAREPSITEIRVLDTYWSDHCRHTTFLTEIESVAFEAGKYAGVFNDTYQLYLKNRNNAKEICLMDLATAAMKELRKQGKLADLDESDEINACSIVVPVQIDGKAEEWLVMFKNETHNHPTEIEPFGGAATCLGGAIRDPLSGRAYVYQAMRVTGSGDPRATIAMTIPGKLPQRKITTGAAAGYSSYGNQIGLATGQVAEIYDQGYLAKRLEIGAVIGAAPRKNVVRIAPSAGDLIVLLGGRTGRDGCGGATGSSKAHTEESLATCGAEVQKGNPPTERKLQRLFRNPEVSQLIKKCNDFGAGGVAVAIGELADGLIINLDAVPKKYEGLDGTELAISESQERMAVVVGAAEAMRLIDAARLENLEATIVAEVTAAGRLQMNWRGQQIVDLSREFLNTNGVRQTTQVEVTAPEEQSFFMAQNSSPELAEAWREQLSQLNVCSQKGLVERFDSTIGAGSVLLPFGGRYQLSPMEGMAAKLPVLDGETKTGTLMSYGYDPEISKWSPFHGAVYAVVEAVTKIAALGGDYQKVRLTLQEYFERLGKDPKRWGKPFSALLGAYLAQTKLGLPAIGGKDSMSGSFKDLDVPPTLVAFAVAVTEVDQVVSTEFKKSGSQVVLIPLQRDQTELPVWEDLHQNLEKVHALAVQQQLLAARTIRTGGVGVAITQMCFGNMLGFEFAGKIDQLELFRADYGSLVLELPAELELAELLQGVDYQLLGKTIQAPVIEVNGLQLQLSELLTVWQEPLEEVFPTKGALPAAAKLEKVSSVQTAQTGKPRGIVQPRVFMPVFPGTNCEYDSTRAFMKAGAVVDQMVFRNLSAREIEASVTEMAARIEQAQIIMIPGGFSAGDEPEGSGKFIATVFRNPRIAEAVMRLLKERDGLILGICNGFQALIKLGLLPYGEIRELDQTAPTLTFNTLGRHVSCMTETRICSKLSPWLSKVEVGAIHTIPVSHGEGRFVATPAVVAELIKQGQIATQYVDLAGAPSMELPFNPNGSVMAIEGITSPDGRILGKMGHSERIGKNVGRNISGNQDQHLFEAGVAYFK